MPRVYQRHFYTGVIKLLRVVAGWQSGYAAACKAVYAGSIPTPAFTFSSLITYTSPSPGGGTGRRKGLKIPREAILVPVRLRPRAPIKYLLINKLHKTLIKSYPPKKQTILKINQKIS